LYAERLFSGKAIATDWWLGNAFRCSRKKLNYSYHWELAWNLEGYSDFHNLFGFGFDGVD
jgi:hypothetical protein